MGRSLNAVDTWEITAADPAHFLSELHSHSVPVTQVQMADELTIRFRASKQWEGRIEQLARQRDVKWKIIGRAGIYWSLIALLKRPVLTIGLLFFVVLTLILPSRILFFRVEGNAQVPAKQIVALAGENGLDFGTLRRDVRSEKVKNALLKAIPQLEWVGINTAGCVATISVRERQSASNPPQDKLPSSIVAVRDGTVQEIIVTAGSASVQRGQEVKAGQVLISGYTDCGLSIRAERAKGEVYATTEHHLTLIFPQNDPDYNGLTAEQKNISLQFGKNRINFAQNSGILDTTCVKMYEENYITLPGGFILPIGIITEQSFYHTSMNDPASPETSLLQAAERYLHGQMIAGTILSREETITQDNGVWRLEGRYVCLEMIGREQSEEIIVP